MSFTTAEKVSIRRFMGYPAFGNAATQHFGHRFMTAYGQLEYKMNNLSDDEEAVVRDYLSKCTQLETDLYGTRDNMDTASAAVWTRNSQEVGERSGLLRMWCMKLCDLFGIPPGPSQAKRNSRSVVV